MPLSLRFMLSSRFLLHDAGLKIVRDQFGNKFILHLEFQSHIDAKMVYRMAEYKALIQGKYELPVRQFLIYLGRDLPHMRTELSHEEKITGFELKNIHELDAQQILNSEIPEEIILSILADYPKSDTEHVISRIIQGLQYYSENETQLQRYLQQLMVLSRLRKLDGEIEKKLETMPIVYDIKKDRLYNQGIEQGIEKGVEQTKVKMIEGLLKQGLLTEQQIAEVAEVELEHILQVKSELR